MIVLPRRSEASRLRRWWVHGPSVARPSGETGRPAAPERRRVIFVSPIRLLSWMDRSHRIGRRASPNVGEASPHGCSHFAAQSSLRSADIPRQGRSQIPLWGGEDAAPTSGEMTTWAFDEETGLVTQKLATAYFLRFCRNSVICL